MPAIVDASKKYEQSGLVVLAVDVQEDKTLVQPFVNEFSMPFPVGIDSTGEAVGRYKVRGIPTSIFVGRDGKIRFIQVGPMTPDILENQLKSL